MPECEVVIGQEDLKLLVVLLDALVLFLKALAHAESHVASTYYIK